MESNILKFRLKDIAGRLHALRWLAMNIEKFPEDIDIGPELFHGWRFVKTREGKIYFANCINRGISEEDFESFIKLATG